MIPLVLLVGLAAGASRDARAAAGAASPRAADALRSRLDRAIADGHAGLPATLALAESLVAARRAAPRRDDPALATALERLGEVLTLEAAAPAADSALSEAVGIRRARSAKEPAALGGALTLAAGARRIAGRLADATQMADEAVSWIRRATPVDTMRLVAAVRLRGAVETERGHVAAGDSTLAVALAWSNAGGPAYDRVRALILRDQARVKAIAGDLKAARALAGDALALQERLLGPAHADLVQTLTNLSQYESSLGDFVAARPLAERALAIREATYGPMSPLLSAALIRLGAIHRDLGDQAEALRLFQRALAIQQAAQPHLPGDLSYALSTLADLEVDLGHAREGREHFEEAYALRCAVLGPRHTESLYLRGRRAEAMIHEGRAAEAEAELDSVVALLHGQSARQEAGAQLRLGFAADALGHLAKARDAFAACRALSDRLDGPWSAGSRIALAGWIAPAYWLGERDTALDVALELESRAREEIRLAAVTQSEREATSFLGLTNRGLDIALTAAADGLDAARRREVLDAVIRSRDVVFAARLDQRRRRAQADSTGQALARALEAARLKLAGALVESAGDSAAVATARAASEAAERALGMHDAAYAGASGRVNGTLDDVARALPEGAALVSYARYARLAPRGAGQPAIPDTIPSYVALVLRHGDADVRVFDLGPTPPVDARVTRWTRAAATPPPAEPARARAAEEACRRAGREVRAVAWDPLREALLGARTVFVVPDGSLRAIDWAALPGAGASYLAETGPLVHRLSAERDLLDPPASASGTGLLAVGDPAFDAPAVADSARGVAPAGNPLAGAIAMRGGDVRLGPLPGAEREVEEIAARWRTGGRGEAIVRTGAAADEPTVRALAPRCEFLHLATHAVELGEEDAPLLAVGLRGVGGIAHAGDAAGAGARAVEPGLAFAGANRAASTAHPERDGMLTAGEIESLPLDGVRWAVLSACATGLADPAALEGVQGLERAFRLAGVRTVVMSLWSVDDDATRQWMDALYRARLERRLATADAVQAAHRAVLRARRAAGKSTHPFYWAAFVASGDWR